MKTFLTLSLLLLTTYFTNAQWFKLPGPIGGSMSTVAQVGNEVWAGGYAGLYISSNDGLSWQKSSMFDGKCNTILSFNDTVVICYNIVDGFDYKTYSISSFDNGLSWSTPYLLNQPYNFGNGILKKTGEAIYFFSDSYSQVSFDCGLTWALAEIAGVDIYDVYSNGEFAIATVSIPFPSAIVYYYSPDGTSPWTLLSNSGMANIVFANNNRIFISYNWMSQDSILKTDDFGLTWDNIYTGAGASVSIMFEHNNNLYLRGSQDSLVSTDNGLTWNPGTFPDDLWQCPGIFTSSGNWLHTYSGVLTTYFPSADTSVTTNTGIVGSNLTSLYENKDVLFTSGEQSFYRSTDGGLSWSQIDSVQATIETMFFIGDSIYAVDQTYGIFARSYDNGLNWYRNTIPSSTSGSRTPGVCRLNGTIYINGYASFFSNDEGITWDTLLALPGGTFGCFLNSDTYGTVTSFFGSLFSYTISGYLFRYNDTTTAWDFLHCWGTAGAWPGNFMTQVGNHLVLGNRNKLFMSADSGNTWIESLYSGLPLVGTQYYIPKNIIEVGGYWFCTMGSYGIYFSNDFGMSWQPLPFNQEFVPTQGLVSLNNVLYTIGFCNGIWRRQNSLFNLMGKVYRDINNNSLQDAGENGLKDKLLITSPGNFTATSDSAGNYTLISDIPGIVSVVIPGTYVTNNPVSYSFSEATDSLDFGIYMPPNIFDLNCDMTNINVFSPGFQTNIQLTLTNDGSFTNTSQLKLTLDSALNFNSSIPTPDAINGDTLYWNVGALDFLEVFQITVSVTTGIWSTGDVVQCTLEAYPITGDTTPLNNISLLEDAVVGSYDPNDKTCVQGAFFTSAQLSNNEELHYVIRFQNTGNAPTSFIVITDTLTPLLDFSTFRMISSSHPCTWSMAGWGNLRVEYNPIAIPPSSIDEPGSHGYFKYGIKCREAVVLGNAIDNTAAIYFDFNAPVITNTVTTLIFDPVTVNVPEITPSIVNILPYPNPSFDYIQIKFLNSTYPGTVSIHTFDVMGNLVSTDKIDPSSGSMNISGFSQGIYFSVVSDKNGKRLGGFKFTKVN